MVHRAVGIALAACLAGCWANAPKPKPEPVVDGQSHLFRADAIRVHDAAIAVLAAMGEKVEEDRGDGQYLQTISEERPDHSRLRTHVSISPQQAGGTRITVRRGVVEKKNGHEIEWTSLPPLPAAVDAVLDAIARHLQEAGR